ncbi:hypothetical protein TSUD_409790 [Trifolium subterraneum]|uniref:Reverse transcriptase domain-containing protein n=1 Tax=Trifolium subterraneum TaxID=3900 RepID=A0A2Z6P295_TRISU|nr:hypothetical protein TSUD_409790 [Trifolium subterraneum]
MLDKTLSLSTTKFLETFSSVKGTSRVGLRGSNTTLRELTPYPMSFSGVISSASTTTSFFKKKCIGTKNLERTGSNSEIRIAPSSTLKLSLEESATGFIGFSFLTGSGLLTVPFFRMRLKFISKISSAVANLIMSPTFPVAYIRPLTKTKKKSLLRPITKEELSVALNSMKPYKAPGPDGFQCIFFKQYWHIVGDDIFNMVKTAFQSGYFDPAISDTLISLIPKIDPPTSFRDFRPISLCNVVYKIITKVLVHRLRPILNTIIGPYQSSFLPGRGTSDNAIVLQEIIHFMRRSKRKKGYVAFKLDLEKAFDNVNWEFLKSCLHDFGFPDTTIQLIMHCVTSSNFSLLWNGNKMPHFKSSHGLRQGDPLSPYLFILCMEKLSIAINNAVQQGNWAPIHISDNGPRLSHLLFADDVLLFSKAKNSQLRFITDLFDHFSRASGLKINLSKSRAFYSAGIPHTKINKLTSISGIRSTVSLDKYLGFPILKGRAKRSDFHFIIDKMQSRLASWKNKLLNKLGRLALASSVISSIPSYYMQISWLPQSICDSIDQTTRNFIWRDSNNKGIHLVSWKKIARPKQHGGLSIRTARGQNISLLGKLVWDMVQSSNKLWVDLLSSKYVKGSTFLLSGNNSSGSPTWSSIIQAKNILKDGFSWRAGSGTSSFWSSHWTTLGQLGALVPYIDIHDLQLSIKDVLSTNSPHTHILYTQLPPSVSDLINNIHIKFNDSIDDAFIWTSNKNGSYTTKSGYNWLLSLQNLVTPHNPSLSWSWIWKLQLPEKIKFFFWLACHNSVPTLSLLNHRKMNLSATCARCGLREETFLHCVRDCDFSISIWHHIGFDNPYFFSSMDAHDWLKWGSTGSKAFIFSAGVWWSWRHCNLMCLNNGTWSLTRLSFNIHSMVDTFKNCFN